MISWRVIRDGQRNPREAIYSNGFRFIGAFDENEHPKFGTITDDKGNLVYDEGIIEDDIYLYFQKYVETNKPIKSKKP